MKHYIVAVWIEGSTRAVFFREWRAGSRRTARKGAMAAVAAQGLTPLSADAKWVNPNKKGFGPFLYTGSAAA